MHGRARPGAHDTMRAAIALAALLGGLALAGCNTVEGIGKDVKAAGQSIERAAKK